MDSNAYEINTESIVVEYPTNLKTDEESAKLQEDEVSEKTETEKTSVKQITKKPAKEENLPLKRKNSKIQQLSVEVPNKMKVTENSVSSFKRNIKKAAKNRNLPPKRKDFNRIPTSRMVMEAIEKLGKRNEVTVDDIVEYMEWQYKVNSTVAKRYVFRYLKSEVKKAVRKQFSGRDSGKFKLKKSDKISKIELASETREDRQCQIKKAEKPSMVGSGSRIDARSKMKKAKKAAKAGQKWKVNKMIEAKKK